MNKLALETPEYFSKLIEEIPDIGIKKNAAFLMEHVRQNVCEINKDLRDLPALKGKKAQSGIIVSAGPSVHKKKSIQRILEGGYPGTIIAVDGSYIACLKAGLIPDYVITLDPYGTRVVRWFGDPDFEEHSRNDDYFLRQDLDIDFRKNSIRHNLQNIELVNRFASRTRAVVCSTASPIVVNRLKEAGFDMFWWNPLVDDPKKPKSLTRQFYSLNKLPCLNTGGTVGTSAWVFAAAHLRLSHVALTGVDLGYYENTPIEETQTFYELIEKFGSRENIEKYFMKIKFPLTGEMFFMDPTYYWYRKNFLELIRLSPQTKTYNCTEAGTLVDESIPCVPLDQFLNENK